MKQINQVKEKKTKIPPSAPVADVIPKTVRLRVDLIEESHFEPQIRRRRHFKPEDIERLGESILKHKQRQPILVRPKLRSTNGKVYEIVFGERRWRGCKAKNIEFIDCVVDDLTDIEVLELQYEENHGRQNPDPLDDAFFFTYLKEKENYSNEDLMIKFSLSYKDVLNRLKLNNLIDEGKKQLADGLLPLGHAVYISKFPIEAQKEIISEGYAYKWNDPEDGSVKLSEFKQIVGENVERILLDAPFDPEDTRLHIKGLKCSECPERKGFTAKLFDEIGDKDACLNKKCFQQKSNVHLRITRDAIAEQIVKASVPAAKTEVKVQPDKIEEIVKDVPLVTSRSYVQKEEIPFHEPVLTNQKFHQKAECGFSEASLIVDGPQKGQQTYICRNKECSVHHPKPMLSPEESFDKLQKLENEFNEKVRKMVRHEIFYKAMKFFDDYKPIWIYEDLVQELILKLLNSCGGETRAAVLEIVKDWKVFPKDFSNPLIIKDSIKKLSKTQQSQFIFLLTFASEAFYTNYPQENLKQIAKDYANVEYRLLEAQKRLELAPGEFKEIAQKYLDAVADGEAPEMPKFWTANAKV